MKARLLTVAIAAAGFGFIAATPASADPVRTCFSYDNTGVCYVTDDSSSGGGDPITVPIGELCLGPLGCTPPQTITGPEPLDLGGDITFVCVQSKPLRTCAPLA